MAEKKELHIEISPTGEVSVRVKNVNGASCVDETKFLEAALGGAIASRDLTSEYFEQGITGSVTQTEG